MPRALKKNNVASDNEGSSDEVQTVFGDLVTFVMMLFILLFVLSYNEEYTTDFITEFQIKFGEKVEEKVGFNLKPTAYKLSSINNSKDRIV